MPRPKLSLRNHLDLKPVGQMWHVEGYLGGKRVRRSTGCRINDTVGAEEQKLLWLRDANNGKPPTTVNASPKITSKTVASVVAEYISSRPDMGHTGKVILQRVEDAWGTNDITHIQDSDVEAYFRNRWPVLVRDSTRRREMAQVRAMFQYAVRRGYIDRAPFMQLPTEKLPEFRWLLKNEIERLFAAALRVDKTSRLYLAIYFMLKTGARYSEMADTRFGDFDNGIVTLRSRKGATSKVKTRRIPYIEAYRGGRPKDDCAFVQPNGKPFPLPKRGGAKFPRWQEIVNEAGLKGVTPHDLRHTFASHLRMAGVPIEDIADLLGHADIQTTRRYAHIHYDKAASVVAHLAY